MAESLSLEIEIHLSASDSHSLKKRFRGEDQESKLPYHPSRDFHLGDDENLSIEKNNKEKAISTTNKKDLLSPINLPPNRRGSDTLSVDEDHELRRRSEPLVHNNNNTKDDEESTTIKPRKKSVRFGDDVQDASSKQPLSRSSRRASASPSASPFSGARRRASANVVSSAPVSPSVAAGASSSPSRPALKNSVDEEGISKFTRRVSLSKQLQAQMSRGDILTKYYDGGVSKERMFYISEDGSELRWCKVNRSKSFAQESKLVFADVRAIVFGPRTGRFEKYSWLHGQPYNCFSVIYDGKTLDIECKTREQFMTWFLGIQFLAPLSHKFWSRSHVNWHRALYKTLQIASVNHIDVSQVWRDLVNLSRQELSQKKEYERKNSAKNGEEIFSPVAGAVAAASGSVLSISLGDMDKKQQLELLDVRKKSDSASMIDAKSGSSSSSGLNLLVKTA